MKKKGFNPNYPPKDMPTAELERYWGDPKEIPADFAEKIRADARRRREGKNEPKPSFL